MSLRGRNQNAPTGTLLHFAKKEKKNNNFGRTIKKEVFFLLVIWYGEKKISTFKMANFIF